MSETKWKKTIENFDTNTNTKNIDIKNAKLSLSSDVGKQYDTFLTDNEDVVKDDNYNLNVLNRKLMNIYNKKNNFNKKELLHDLHYDIAVLVTS